MIDPPEEVYKYIYEYFKFKLKDIPIEESYWYVMTEPLRLGSEDHIKITFEVKYLTENDANFICQLFTDSQYVDIDELGNVLNPKEHIYYLTFQCPIDDYYILLDGSKIRIQGYGTETGVLKMNGRFIVQIKINSFTQYIRDEKIDSILN